VLESLWRYDTKCVCALIATAVAALCWPDALAAGKACTVCRAVAALAETSHPELEGLVLADMLRSAIMSTVQVRAAFGGEGRAEGGVAALAGTSPGHPGRGGLVPADMLRSAVPFFQAPRPTPQPHRTPQVSHITIQAEVLGVIRQLLVAWLPRSAAVRDILLSLPHVTPQVGPRASSNTLYALSGRTHFFTFRAQDPELRCALAPNC
jgi:hypothetical protein